MAIITTLVTKFGEEKSVYLRVNNVEVSNHGVKSIALCRGFISEQAFIDKMHFVHEEEVSFNADVSLPIWEQAYSALKEKYPKHTDA